MLLIHQGRAGGVAVLMDLLDGSRQFLVAAEDRYGTSFNNLDALFSKTEGVMMTVVGKSFFVFVCFFFFVLQTDTLIN